MVLSHGDITFRERFGGTTSAGKWGLKAFRYWYSGFRNLSVVPLRYFTFQMEGGAYIIYVNGVNMGEGSDSQTISALNKIGGTLKGEIAEVVWHTTAYFPDLPGRKSKVILLISGDWKVHCQLLISMQ